MVIHLTTGKYIKAARIKAGLTQEGLAQKLGVPYQSISQWERGKRKPKIETLQKIADALEIPLTDLLPNSQDTVFSEFLDAADTYAEYVRMRSKTLLNGDASESEHLKAAMDIEKAADYFIGKKNLSILVSRFEKLNSKGQKIAIERIEELTKIPDYQKDYEEPPGQNQEETSGSPPDTTEDE